MNRPLARASAYDSARHLTRVKDGLGHFTDMSYDGLGQVASVTRYKGGTPLKTSFVYAGGDLVSVIDPLSRSTKFLTDGVGRTLAVTDPLGRITRSEYDGLGRLSAATDAQGNTVRYGYSGKPGQHRIEF
jgi:YD repeat-containing protein